MRLTPLRIQLLETLTWQRRVASERQLSAYLGRTTPCIRRVVRELALQRLAESKMVSVIEYDLQRPLITSAQVDSAADFSALAWAMNRRWLEANRTRMRIIWATHAATRIVGGVGGRLRPLQLEHDLGVSEILSRRRFANNERWVGEDAYRLYWQPTGGSKIPDAVIVDQDDTVTRVVEFGGQYSRKRLADFHRYWISRAPYEIW